MERKNTWKNVDGPSEKNNEGAQPAKQKFYLIRYIYVTILGHSVGYVCIAVSHEMPRVPTSYPAQIERGSWWRRSQVDGRHGQPSMADQCWERIGEVGEDSTSRILFKRGPSTSWTERKIRRDEQWRKEWKKEEKKNLKLDLVRDISLWCIALWS